MLSKQFLLHSFTATIILLSLLGTKTLHAEESIAADSTSAIILAYHRIGEDQYPETSIRKEQFEEHINELIHDSYNVLPLADIIDAIKSKKPLPPRTLAITFEGGYESILRNALPLLNANDIPYTVFYASDLASSNFSQHLNWNELKQIEKRSNATLGILPAAYIRLSNSSNEEIQRQINKATMRFNQNFGTPPKLFSFPFGEYSAQYKKIIEQREFDAAFGLHSGASHAQSDIYALPRFSMTERYGDRNRFILVTNALPLPVIDLKPAHTVNKTMPTTIEFTTAKELKGDLKSLSCFISGQKKPTIKITDGTHIQLSPHKPIETERTRVNCTLPGPENEDGIKQWRWLGMLLTNDVK